MPGGAAGPAEVGCRIRGFASRPVGQCTWRRANARTPVRPATPGASSFAGMEADALVNFTVCKSLVLTAGYSHFFAGGYLDDTGAGDDADFFYFMTGLKF